MADVESFDYGEGSFEFSEKSVRRNFIKKVYGILSLQLVITFGIVLLFSFVDTIKQGVADNPAIFWSAFGVSIVLIIILVCAGEIRRKVPFNFIFLFLFTICEGVVLGCIAAQFDVWEVSVAVVATLAVSLALTLFAFQTKIDFTMMSGLLVAAIMVLFTFGIFAIIFQNRILNLVYSCLGALIFSLYLVFDTQMILGGKHKYSISPEEYVFAALNLYLDVVNLFIMLLAIIGGGRS